MLEEIKKTAAFIDAATDSFAPEVGVILGTGTWDKGDVYRHPALKQAYEMGRSI